MSRPTRPAPSAQIPPPYGTWRLNQDRRRGGSRMYVGAAAWIVVLLTACPSAVVGGHATPGPAPRVERPVDPGTGALQAAIHSVSSVGGPAPGAALRCGSILEDSVACRPTPSTGRSPAVGASPWTNLTPSQSSSPTPSMLVSMTYDAADQYVVLFGGGDVLGPVHNATWKFANGTWTQLHPTRSPAPRRSALIAYDAVDGYVVLFGGFYAPDYGYQDTWTFSAGQWHNATAPVINATNTPSIRWNGAMAYDATDQYVVLFGGCEALYCAQVGNDTWTYRGGTWTNRTGGAGTAPSPRGTGAMAWDPESNAVILYGGGGGPADDTWRFVGGKWTELFPFSSPGFLTDEYLTYDAGDGYLLVFGGQTVTGTSAATWIFNGTEWVGVSDIISRAPAARWGFEGSGVYDAHDGYVLLFGGVNVAGALFGDTWAFHWPLTAALNASPSALDANQSVTFTTIPLGGSLQYSYQYSGLPTGCRSVNASHLTCRFPTNGTFLVEVNVTDSAGANTTAGQSVLVDRSLVVTGRVSPIDADLGQSIQIAVTVLYGTGGRTYAYAGLPQNCTAADLAVLRCVPDATGPFNASVRVTDAAGDAVTLGGLNGTVNPALEVTAGATPAYGAPPLNTSLHANATGGTPPYAYSWDLGDGTTGSGDAVSHVYRTSGVITAHVTVSDAAGSNLTIPVAVQAIEPFVVNASANRTAGDSPMTVAFLAADSGEIGAVHPAWRFGDGGTSVAADPVHTFYANTTSTFEVHLTEADESGRTALAEVNVTLYPTLSLVLIAASTSVVLGSGVSLDANLSGGSGGLQYVWAGLPPGCATDSGPLLQCTPSAAGNYAIQVTVRDSVGGTVDATVYLQVLPKASDTLEVEVAAAAVVGVVVVVIGLVLWHRGRRGPPPDP